ncbi:MAG: OadG family protein [Clostridia bacterium]|nr:OadG family protein [Clostridia bacterium]
MDLIIMDTFAENEAAQTTAPAADGEQQLTTTGTIAQDTENTKADLDPFVVTVVGMGIVFLGLIALIAIVKLIGTICRAAFGEKKTVGSSGPELPQTKHQPTVAASNLTDAQRGELVAAISAAIAENMGKPISGIRIRSIRKVG